MSFAITPTCCNDASCVSVCPVNCIHPTPDEPSFGTTEMLYIDPEVCIDCGACVSACPVEAIFADSDVPEKWQNYTGINAEYFKK
jgi:ferredoxin--NADP+ reductase